MIGFHQKYDLEHPALMESTKIERLSTTLWFDKKVAVDHMTMKLQLQQRISCCLIETIQFQIVTPPSVSKEYIIKDLPS